MLNSDDGKGLKLLLVGHTDDQAVSRKPARDRFEDNFDLSTARAHQVAETLQRMGSKPNESALPDTAPISPWPPILPRMIDARIDVLRSSLWPRRYRWSVGRSRLQLCTRYRRRKELPGPTHEPDTSLTQVSFPLSSGHDTHQLLNERVRSPLWRCVSLTRLPLRRYNWLDVVAVGVPHASPACAKWLTRRSERSVDLPRPPT